ncbi:AfsR/SARP family transcriptional regulator [Actinokineospora enzanensis]|uniref:AfsR/SARP family transcriptional regulator n=1 Tax=Actinokineospora enzanensis TaxID=155975 RepID=UPI00037D4604
MLALLTVGANRLISVDALVEELWEGTPPRSGVNTARTYIYQLRRLFANAFGEARAERLVQTQEPGYVLRLPPGTVDTADFDMFHAMAKEYLASGDIRTAAECATEALVMWRGPALSNVRIGPLLQTHVAGLEDRRIAALQLRTHIDLLLGKHVDLIGELRALVTEHPFNEWFHAQLMVALTRAGRRNDALHAYRSVRSILNEELGLEPSAVIREVHRSILAEQDQIDAPLLTAV